MTVFFDFFSLFHLSRLMISLCIPSETMRGNAGRSG